MERVGLLTGGGDCPGLNAVIRAVVRRALPLDLGVVGIRNGWAGLVDGEVEPLTAWSVSGILPRGGTILGSSRRNPFKKQEDLQRLLDNVRRFGLGSLVAIGGEDTLGVAWRLHQEHGLHVVGIPKTIDNDLNGTDYTFGFDTAVGIVTEAIDRLHTTAESHHRTIVVEVMGRHAGWIAVHSGLAGGADAVLIPERPFNVQKVCDLVRRRVERGKYFSIIVVSEGARPDEVGHLVTQDGRIDEFGHERLGGIGELLARRVEEETGIETRAVVLGHVQRGGTPTAFDRVLATRFGVRAVDLVRGAAWGRMVALRGTAIVDCPIEEAVRELKTVDPDLYATAEVFFG
ncbi:MAG: 6-phosphofructokinase [Planctomycetes bacterium]|nr:6-phosphofructokinase [Planctomycetota bacterium]